MAEKGTHRSKTPNRFQSNARTPLRITIYRNYSAPVLPTTQTEQLVIENRHATGRESSLNRFYAYAELLEYAPRRVLEDTERLLTFLICYSHVYVSLMILRGVQHNVVGLWDDNSGFLVIIVEYFYGGVLLAGSRITFFFPSFIVRWLILYRSFSRIWWRLGRTSKTC